jgi:hypothetical protein
LRGKNYKKARYFVQQQQRYNIYQRKESIFYLNKKFWKGLICLLSLHYLNQNCPSGSLRFIIFLHFIHLWRKLNSLQIMTLHKITEFYTEWFSVYPNITSKFRTIAIFKNCVKQKNDSNKTYRCVHDLLLYQSSFV